MLSEMVVPQGIAVHQSIYNTSEISLDARIDYHPAIADLSLSYSNYDRILRFQRRQLAYASDLIAIHEEVNPSNSHSRARARINCLLCLSDLCHNVSVT